MPAGTRGLVALDMDGTGGEWHDSFRLTTGDPTRCPAYDVGSAVVGLRLVDGKPLTETWSYQWTAPK